jgi:lysophospholipase L1-like esterase
MRVLVFGDSITQGFWDIEGGWVSRLRKSYDQIAIETDDYDQPTIFNMGVSGNSSNEILDRFNNEAKARLWPGEEMVFIFSIGVNDTRIEGDKDFSNTTRYIQNLSELLKLATQYTNKNMFVGLTPCIDSRTTPTEWGNKLVYNNQRIKEFDEALRRFCEQSNTCYLNLFKPFQEKQARTELIPDGVHPNSEGHQLITELIKPKLEMLIL